MKLQFPKITIWRAIFAAIMLSGLYATYLRVMYGLGGSTNLSDKFPWGIWIGFDVMCGVGLAAGGFTLVAMVHIFNIEAYKPVLRPAILTAFLGYSLVVVGLLFDLGRPDRLWHPLVMWNPHSVMFEVAWCVTLYSTVLFLEFLPMVFEKFGMAQAAGVDPPDLGAADDSRRTALHAAPEFAGHTVPDRAGEAVCAVVHADSAVAVLDFGDRGGPGHDHFRSWHSSRAFGRALELPLLASMGRVLAVLMSRLPLGAFPGS